MFNSVLLAEAEFEEFTPPGYTSGSELPPLPVQNTYEDVPVNVSSLNMELIFVVVGIFIVLTILILLFTLSKRGKKQVKSLTKLYKEDKIDPELKQKIEVVPKTSPNLKPVRKNSSGLSTPSEIKHCVKSFLERTKKV